MEKENLKEIMKYLKERYFELKERIIGNTGTTKRIDTLNYFSDGTITDFCYTTITRFNGNTYKHKYSYRLMK